MADKNYRTIVGFVQFDVEERKVSNATVRDVTVRAAGSEGPLVSVTVWPEYADHEIQRGDFVAIDGDLQVRVGQTSSGEKREFLNLSASKIYRNGELLTPKEREVVNRKAKSKGKF